MKTIFIVLLIPSFAFASHLRGAELSLYMGQVEPPPGQSWWMTMFIQYVAPTLFAGLAALIGYALKKLADFLHTKEQNSKMAGAAAAVTSLAQSTVAELNATLKPQLESALSDGVLTDAEKKKLKEAALDVLKSKLPAGMRDVLSATFGAALDHYLGGLIEQSVTAAKIQAASLPRSP